MLILLAQVLVLVLQVTGQVSHTVTVGVEGSFFNPPTVSANLGDTILFVFGGDFHSVSQGSFDTPCQRLDGGFDSGFRGRGPNFADPTPIWSITITNASEPIWFFCMAGIPTSHCESGMVGAINPPSIDMYNQYVSAAKAVTSTPKPTPSFIPSGQGALATAPPMLSSVPLSSLLSSLSFTPSTTATADVAAQSTISSVPAASPSRGTKLSTGLIAGCATAGGLLLLAFIALAYHCGNRRRKRQHLNDLDYPQLGSYRSAKANRGATASNIILAGVPSPPPTSSASYDDERKPLNAHQDSSHLSASPQAGIRPLPNPTMYSNADAPVAQPPVDINALAMEVASVLLQTPPKVVSGPRSQSQQSRSRRPSPNANASVQKQQQNPAPDTSMISDPDSLNPNPHASANSSRWYDYSRQSDEGVDGRGSVAPPYTRHGL